MIPLELARSIQEIASTIAETDDCAADDDGARKSALRAARTLVKKLENPRDTAFRHAFESHNRSLCLRLAAELKLFHHISKLELATAEQLSERCGAEELLIVRIMRLLTAEGYAEEQEPSSWSPTALTAAMTQPALEACLIHGFDITARVQSHLIEYFKRTNFRCPTSADDGAFQYGIQTDLNFFDFLHANPGRAAIFNTYMTGNRSTRKHWLQWYPFAEKVLYPWSHRSRAKDRNVLLVDMGGGKGRDLRALLNAFPEAAGQVVLQDLPGTLKDIRDDRDGIQFCPHDLFAAQPVKGAEIYYTHFVLHDFPDELCVIMMRHVKDAMGPTSRILLNEIVLPESGCPSFFAAADITMMTNLSARARTEVQWRSLIKSAGMNLLQVWRSHDEDDWEAVIEVIASIK